MFHPQVGGEKEISPVKSLFPIMSSLFSNGGPKLTNVPQQQTEPPKQVEAEKKVLNGILSQPNPERRKDSLDR